MMVNDNQWVDYNLVIDKLLNAENPKRMLNEIIAIRKVPFITEDMIRVIRHRMFEEMDFLNNVLLANPGMEISEIKGPDERYSKLKDLEDLFKGTSIVGETETGPGGQMEQKTNSELTINQIALIHVYNGTPIARGDSANRIAEAGGHTSGTALYNKYTHWRTATNRTGEEATDLKTQNKIDLIKSIIKHLSNEGQERASAEIKTLESKLPKK